MTTTNIAKRAVFVRASAVAAVIAFLVSACAMNGVEGGTRGEIATQAGNLAVAGPDGPLSREDSEKVIEDRVPAAERKAGVQARLKAMLSVEEQIARAALVTGNRARILIDGPETLAEMHKSIEAARREIYVETFILADDPVGQRVADALLDARKRGVVVRLIYDAAGSVRTPDEFFEPLERVGVEVRKFNPVDPIEDPRLWRINHRNHRKLLIVDGRTTFLGGVNFSEEYASSSAITPGEVRGLNAGWRDTHLRIDGPVSGDYRALFFRSWAETGEPVTVTEVEWPATSEVFGDDLVRPLASSGGDEAEYVIYQTYRSAVQHSAEKVWLTHAYFSPDEAFLDDIEDAAKRGVDVRLLLPGFLDFEIVRYASRANYHRLLEAGVRIFERTDALLHAKTAVVDGVWSTVGSANLDMRSFVHNDEVNAVVVGSSFGAEMEDLFLRDCGKAREITLKDWQQRSWLERLKEFVSRRLNYWL